MLRGMAFAGPNIWATIHSEAVTYTPENAEAFRAFIYSQTSLLPCEKCRKHFKENLNNYPLDDYLDSNHNLFFWTYLIHDIVNKSLGKKSPPYDQVKRKYFDALASECKGCKI